MIKKKKIFVNDHLFKKENFYKYDYYKKKYKIIFNKFNRSLTDIDLKKLFYKNKDIIGIIAGLENYNFQTTHYLNSLKAISRVGVGLDSLDLDYFKKKSIKVFRLKNELTTSVAELYVSLILTIIRKIINNLDNMRRGHWDPIIGNNLYEKKIGIIGYGKIGKKIHRLLKAFNCEFFIFEKRKIKIKNVKQTSLSKVFAKCDIVCIAINFSRETDKIINSKILNKANKNLVLINASRGGVINESHLLKFLQGNRTATAFLDCFTVEPYYGKLIKQPNIYSLPHIASYTVETRKKMELSASKSLVNYLDKINK